MPYYVYIFGAGAFGTRLAESIVPKDSELRVRLVSREECDIGDIAAVMRVLGPHYDNVTTVVNAAAMTSVDGCEKFPELALRTNAVGAGNLALAARIAGAGFVHISTDYVFPGGHGPYTTDDIPLPIQAYGDTKLLGEAAVRAFNPRSVIVRVGWLYGVEYPTKAPMMAVRDTYTQRVRVGNVHTKAHKRVYVWDDMWGSPTFLGDAVDMLRNKLEDGVETPQTVHMAPRAVESWFSFLHPHFGDAVQRTKIPNGFAPRPRRGGLVPTPGWELPEDGFGRFLLEADFVT